MRKILTDFAIGLIIGILAASIIWGCITGIAYYRRKNKELIEYAQRQQAIEELQEDINNLDYVELLDTVPGVRGAADGAAADFERKRDEILERFRSRITD